MSEKGKKTKKKPSVGSDTSLWVKNKKGGRGLLLSISVERD